MKITVPYPPTANLYWRHAQGRTFLSAAAKAFKTEVRKRLVAARVTPQEGPLAFHVHVYRPRKVGDLDNTLKVLGDALNGVAWHDDKQVVEIHAYRHDDKQNPRAEVEVTPAQPVTLVERLTADAVLAHAVPRKGDAAKARECGRQKMREQYTPPRSKPVGRRCPKGCGNHGWDNTPSGWVCSDCAMPPAEPVLVDAAKEAEATFAPAEPRRSKVCLDPDKMNGAGDQFPGSDYD